MVLVGWLMVGCLVSSELDVCRFDGSGMSLLSLYVGSSIICAYGIHCDLCMNHTMRDTLYCREHG